MRLGWKSREIVKGFFREQLLGSDLLKARKLESMITLRWNFDGYFLCEKLLEPNQDLYSIRLWY
jgi:hypothetical protein